MAVDQDIVDSNRSWRQFLCVVGLAIVFLAVLVSMLRSQAPPSYKPTETQLLKLQVKQRDAWLAQRDFLDAQKRYQQAVQDLNALGEGIRRENGWPDTVIFNADKIEYSEPPKGGARPGAPGVGEGDKIR